MLEAPRAKVAGDHSFARQSRRVTIVDYQMGNQQSVANAFEGLGCEGLVSNRPEDIAKADRIILPGVGAFGEGMEHLKSLHLDELIIEQVVEKKKPFLGICLGMQILADLSHEFGVHEGLGLIPGEVKRLKAEGLLLPHVGWNDIKVQRKSELLEGIVTGSDFYFVHSFHFAVKSPGHAAATCEYGEEFVAIVEKDNIFGVQFHPEKSQKAGRRLLENFLKL